MKLTIMTLTGDKLDVEVNAEDKVNDIKVSIREKIEKNQSADRKKFSCFKER